jgi:hypothetical protein
MEDITFSVPHYAKVLFKNTPYRYFREKKCRYEIQKPKELSVWYTSIYLPISTISRNNIHHNSFLCINVEKIKNYYFFELESLSTFSKKKK